MPNHIHAIIIINPPRNVETPRWGVSKPENETTHRVVSTLQKNSLGSIVGQIKSISTKQIRLIDNSFQWQTRFWDNIIRNEHALDVIREYIKNNTRNWEHDRNNPIEKEYLGLNKFFN